MQMGYTQGYSGEMECFLNKMVHLLQYNPIYHVVNRLPQLRLLDTANY